MFTEWGNGSLNALVYLTIATLGVLGLYLIRKIHQFEQVEAFFDRNGRHAVPMGVPE